MNELKQFMFIFCSQRLKDKSNDIINKSIESDSVKVPLDLGFGYSTDFEVFDKDFVQISVGFNFYCQMTWKEAEQFCNSRIEILKRRRNKIEENIKKIEEHLNLTNEIIFELTKQEK